jgi:FixJ family two-component response regulator
MPTEGAGMETEIGKSDKTVVAVVDDDESLQRSLVRLLDMHGFEATAFSSSESLLAEIDTLCPDCVIADLAMPGLSGLELQQRLSTFECDYPILFLSGFGDVPSSVRAMRGGAVDFLVKPVERDVLLEAIARAVAHGRQARQLKLRLSADRSCLATLTGRERQVFELVVKGYLNKQIAASLDIAEKTVKVHRTRVMRKMSVRSVAQLARIAERIVPEHTHLQ